jgi:NAD(P) transhydrogenase
MTDSHYDLIVIGGGAAGEKGAAQAAYFGKKVAMIEGAPHLGGATAGTTVPSKTLRETSLTLTGYQARKLHGVEILLKNKATVQDFLRHEENVKVAEQDRAKANMLRHQVNVINGMASFAGLKEIEVKKKDGTVERLSAKIILIATGSRPRRPDNFPNDERIYDSDTILEIKEIPKTMVVIGGGVIGCEYACIFRALGTDVYLVHGRDQLLPFLDQDISESLTQSFIRMGIQLVMNENVASCEAHGEGIKIHLESGKVLESDAVMLATGRNSNTDKLNLSAAGVKTGKYGLLVVDKNYQVVHPETKAPVEGLYASGDVIGAPALASTSMEQARYAMINAFNLDPYKKLVAPILPMGIYTIPECSGAGKTEQDCIAEGLPYVIGCAYYKQNARGMIIGDLDGMLKLIFTYDDETKKDPLRLIGVHVVGEIASELVHTGLTAMLLNATHDIFINMCFNYPTLGELYKYATYDAMGRRYKKKS